MRKLKIKIRAIQWLRKNCDWKRYKENRRRYNPRQTLLAFLATTPTLELLSAAFLWDADVDYNWFAVSYKFENYVCPLIGGEVDEQ